MGPLSIWKRISLWLEERPIVLSYRIIWLSALLGSSIAKDVHKAMWDARLNIPTLS